MPKIASGGIRANNSGKGLEASVDMILRDYGYTKIKPPELIYAARILEQNIYCEQVTIGKDIYEKSRRCDFLLFNKKQWGEGLVIQCKWQASPGSVEEKYPFEVQSIEKCTFKTIIILDGKGYSVGAENWLKSNRGKGNLIDVFSLGEFQNFASKGQL